MTHNNFLIINERRNKSPQDNLRGKLEQLSTMYEEVSTRMDNLEKAYAQAENEVRYDVANGGAAPSPLLETYSFSDGNNAPLTGGRFQEEVTRTCSIYCCRIRVWAIIFGGIFLSDWKFREGEGERAAGATNCRVSFFLFCHGGPSYVSACVQ